MDSGPTQFPGKGDKQRSSGPHEASQLFRRIAHLVGSLFCLHNGCFEFPDSDKSRPHSVSDSSRLRGLNAGERYMGQAPRAHGFYTENHCIHTLDLEKDRWSEAGPERLCLGQEAFTVLFTRKSF